MPQQVKLPLLLSVPHAGLRTPPEVESYSILTQEEIVADGDVGAAEIYSLRDQVEAFLTTGIARAFVDLNRSEDDRRPDGVVKTHTCWNVSVYREPLPDSVIEAILRQHYRPYHQRLRELATANVRLGIDCHTMAAVGPPVGPDPGMERPWVCVSNAQGTCPQPWIDSLRDCLAKTFNGQVLINQPFQGGYITRSHSAEMPWVQLELSRAPFMMNADKREAVLRALSRWCARWT